MIGDKEILKLAFEVHTAGMLEVIETGKMPNVIKYIRQIRSGGVEYSLDKYKSAQKQIRLMNLSGSEFKKQPMVSHFYDFLISINNSRINGEEATREINERLSFYQRVTDSKLELSACYSMAGVYFSSKAIAQVAKETIKVEIDKNISKGKIIKADLGGAVSGAIGGIPGGAAGMIGGSIIGALGASAAAAIASLKETDNTEVK
tara:strand:+ start:8265 stop:8876 length:612 start_codon:yes stop_codon:yes gene_type:complete